MSKEPDYVTKSMQGFNNLLLLMVPVILVGMLLYVLQEPFKHWDGYEDRIAALEEKLK